MMKTDSFQNIESNLTHLSVLEDLSPASADVKNAWIYTSAWCVVKHSDNLTFILLTENFRCYIHT
jgi:hypothetical protein